jgi:hypothetical protein
MPFIDGSHLPDSMLPPGNIDGININECAYRDADAIICGPGMGALYGDPGSYDPRIPDQVYKPIREMFLMRQRGGNVIQLHQPVMSDFDPRSSAALRGQPWTQLRSFSIDDFRAFKMKNKLALQARYGLHEDSSKILLTSINRVDNYQKCSFAVLESAFRVLEDNPETQLILVGNSAYVSDSERESYSKRAEELSSTFPMRVTIVGNHLDHADIAKLLSGSDYHLFLSIAEVFANALNEGCSLGSIPIVSQTPPLEQVCSQLGFGHIIPISTFDPRSYVALSARHYVNNNGFHSGSETLKDTETSLAELVTSFIREDARGDLNIRLETQRNISMRSQELFSIDAISEQLGEFLVNRFM